MIRWNPVLEVLALPGPEESHDLIDLAQFVLRAFARIDVRDVDDGLPVRIKDLHDRVEIPPGIEIIAEVQRLQKLIAVELFVVGVGDRLEPLLVGRRQDRGRVAPEIGARHCDDVDLVPAQELRELPAQHVIAVGRNVVEFIDGDQPIVERHDAQLIDGEPERGMGADQDALAARKKLRDRLDLGLGDTNLVNARRVAEVPLRLHLPVREEAGLRELDIGKAAADRPLRHDDHGLPQLLVLQLVERDVHQGTGLAGRRRRLDDQVLFAALGERAFLHHAHAHFVRPRRGAGAGILDRNGRNGDLRGHDAALAFFVFSSLVILVYMSNSFSSRSVSFLNRRPI